MARWISKISHLCAVVCLCVSISAWATEYHGQVFYGGVPVPGATVTVTQGDKTLSTVTDQQGLYQFAALADGAWKIEIAMSGFVPLDSAVTVAPNMAQGNWELKLLSLDQLLAKAQVGQPLKPRPEAVAKQTADEKTQKPAETNVPAAPPENDSSDQSADGMLINGSENNAATSQYSLSPAFGNRRPGQKGLYNGSIGAIAGNSVFDARPYSLTGQQTPKDFYNRITTVVTLGGPLRIPKLMPIGPNFFVAYQWTRNTDVANQTGLVPTLAERDGDLSGLQNAQGQPIVIYDPVTGLPYTGHIPVSPQAAALLNLYPLPNLGNSSRYNYQAAVLNNTHADALQSRLNKLIGHRDVLYGGFGFRSSRSDSTNLFNFIDITNSLGIDTNVNWSHRYRHQTFVLLGYHFTRLRTQVMPAFAGRTNVSGNAGIGGNDQNIRNWGPPALSFSSGITGLSDADSAFNRNRTDALSVDVKTDLRRHNFNFGGDFRRQEFNEYGQQNPRGTFVFTGAATQGGNSSSTAAGSDLADFLLGIPDTSAISYGNPDKYFRQSVYDLYFTDDWRMLPELTINAGIRWDFGAPITELYGRLANLDASRDFTSVAAVVASSPKGPVTGNSYPRSLMHPDFRGFEPRIGISWRPIPASTLVVRAGYGIYDDTSVYLSAAQSMATQAPFATSLSQANGNGCTLTLANGFVHCTGATEDTFGVDPHLRVGYAQIWQLSAQRDLPWALVMTATYLGTKGTHGMQEFLPNTYPIGATNPCLTCQTGFVYRTSGGNSMRHAGQVQLRRRLRSGFTASLDYTWAKSIDNDAQVGAQGHTTATAATTSVSSGPGPTIAQNWLDLRAERALSTFDQRQLLKVQLQYTTGMGIGGRTLMSGWRGRLLKEWTLMSQVTTGTGLPETPIYLAAVPGTGVTGTIRPDLTGADIYSAPSGYHLNVDAYAAPASGAWGTARRSSITGPDQFSLNGSMSRTLRLRNPFNLDVRVDATNLLNHGVFSSWNAVVNSKTFGLPGSVNPMRSLQVTARLRF